MHMQLSVHIRPSNADEKTSMNKDEPEKALEPR